VTSRDHPPTPPGGTDAVGPRPRPGDRPVGSERAGAAARTRVDPGRAVAGAALSVAGVALGIVVLHWVTEPPSRPASAVSGLPAATAGQQAVPSSSPTVVPSPRPAPSPAPSSAPSPAPTVPPAASPSPPSLIVPVTVLNNSRRTGLAARGAARAQAAGWPVALVGNFRGRIPVTTAYYDPGLEASARALAHDVDGVVRVRPRFAGLPARGVVLVVTREFGG